jgi:Flp pilus assembly protein TadD
MAKIGRNDPCPCGSGKKHKKCCFGSSLAAAPQVAAAQPEAAQQIPELCDCCIDQLDDRADHILDQIMEGHLDEAEALCHDFMRDFPHHAEGIDLLSMTCQARGQRARALELLRQASKIAHANPDYDAETRSLMRKRIKQLELAS